MNITMENFKTAKYDVFSIFDDRWGLCTAGTPREYNTMTIGWGTMGTIWGPPKKGKQIITVFIRESRRTHQIPEALCCLITKTGMLCLAMRRHFPFPRMKYSEKWDFLERDRKKKLRMAAV